MTLYKQLGVRVIKLIRKPVKKLTLPHLPGESGLRERCPLPQTLALLWPATRSEPVTPGH